MKKILSSDVSQPTHAFKKYVHSKLDILTERFGVVPAEKKILFELE